MVLSTMLGQPLQLSCWLHRSRPLKRHECAGSVEPTAALQSCAQHLGQTHERGQGLVRAGSEVRLVTASRQRASSRYLDKHHQQTPLVSLDTPPNVISSISLPCQRSVISATALAVLFSKTCARGPMHTQIHSTIDRDDRAPNSPTPKAFWQKVR